MAQRIIPDSMKAFYDGFHFAPAVVDGDHVRCSGVIGMNLADHSCPDDPAEQFDLAFRNLKEVLDAAGVTFADVVEMTTFHVGLQSHFETFLGVKDRYINEPYPAWTAIGISELVIPGSLVEIRVTARKA
ncbi:MAG TPA: RidA family protein [Gammaproteobacteria bacterium]|jgi:enamine deaminase RidA (YjgF/YER057c/UK114 family)|nr:RidA family protein [Gammaproteobacteria bacterium]